MQISVRKFSFGVEDTDEVTLVRIPEVLDGNYGMYVWPCAVVLAQYVWHHRDRVKGQRIIELGAGTALPGVLAARLGAHVTLSDACHLPHCLENCHRSCQTNGLMSVEVIGLTWGQFSPEMLQLGLVDVILGSDCFYDGKDFEDVLVTVKYLLEKNQKAEFWTTYQERSSERCIEHLLVKWGMTCKHIALSSFQADHPHLAGSTLPGDHNIQMMVITVM
ncbi:Methyltransferase-like protein 23 [Lamellibrachia satsuma]|nr:Methyltransferase-like protein 23 [Lamellibrachia satsuma]